MAVIKVSPKRMDELSGVCQDTLWTIDEFTQNVSKFREIVSLMFLKLEYEREKDSLIPEVQNHAQTIIPLLQLIQGGIDKVHENINKLQGG